MDHRLFVDLATIVSVVVLFSLVMQRLKQPAIIGYILSGIVVSPYGLGVVTAGEELTIFSELGVSLLLFMVGLSLSPRVLRDVGWVSVLAGMGQIFFTAVIGYCIALLLGFSPMVAAYLAVGLTFSSTIIILKLLSDKGQLTSLAGRIATGILIVQDVAAMGLLIVLPSVISADGWQQSVLLLLLRGGGFALVIVPLGLFVLPPLLRMVAASQELLLLFSIAWSLAVGAFCQAVGLSIEIGALTAGVLLSLSPYRFEVASRLRPLRDFFIVIFFVLLGSQMSFVGAETLIVPVVVFSLFILIGNPLILILLLSALGYPRSVSLRVGLTMAQISEFSFILAALGVRLGHLEPSTLTLLTLVGLVTIAGSTYFILCDEQILRWLDRPMRWLERRRHRSLRTKGPAPEVLLIGHDRVGLLILRGLSAGKYPTLVVDFDPMVVAQLQTQGVPCTYGDINDAEFLSEIDLSSCRMVICTVREYAASSLLVRSLRSLRPDAIIIVLSERTEHALSLYDVGASYVVTPHLLSGQHVASLVGHHGFDRQKFAMERDRHVREMRDGLAR